MFAFTAEAGSDDVFDGCTGVIHLDPTKNLRTAPGATTVRRAVLQPWFLASLVALAPLPVPSADGEVSRQADTMTLESLLRQVRARNPEIAAAKQELEAARQRIAPARALEDPMLRSKVISLYAARIGDVGSLLTFAESGIG